MHTTSWKKAANLTVIVAALAWVGAESPIYAGQSLSEQIEIRTQAIHAEISRIHKQGVRKEYDQHLRTLLAEESFGRDIIAGLGEVGRVETVITGGMPLRLRHKLVAAEAKKRLQEHMELSGQRTSSDVDSFEDVVPALKLEVEAAKAYEAWLRASNDCSILERWVARLDTLEAAAAEYLASDHRSLAAARKFKAARVDEMTEELARVREFLDDESLSDPKTARRNHPHIKELVERLRRESQYAKVLTTALDEDR